VGATTELIQLGVQMTIDGAYLGYFPEVTINCHIARGELKVLTGLKPGRPFLLEAITRKGSTPRAAVRILVEQLKQTIAISSAKTCATD
jgi:DNA-binding transcriptional LysR family regulator